MNEIDGIFQEIEENINLSNVEQVKFFSDILAETKIEGKFEKTCIFASEILKQWHAEQKKQKEESLKKGKDHQISRLLTYFQYLISLFEALSCDSKVFRLFTSSKNVVNNIKLIPQSFFEDQSQKIQSFLQDNEISADIKPELTNYDINDLPKMLSDIKMLKSEMECSVSVDELKKGFSEICAMFELSSLFNDFLINKVNAKEVFDMRPNTELLEMKEKLNKEIEKNKKLSDEIEKQKSVIKGFKKEENILSKVREANVEITRLDEERKKMLLELSKAETCKIENAKLKSELDTLSSQCMRLIEGYKVKKEETSNVKKRLNKVSAQFIKVNERCQILKEELEESQQREIENENRRRKETYEDEKTFIALISNSLGVSLDGSSLSDDVCKICEEIQRLKKANETKDDEIFLYSSKARPSYAKKHAELDKTILNLTKLPPE